MEASLYEPIYLAVIGFLSLATGMRLMITGGNTLACGIHNRGNSFGPLIFCLVLTVWMGLRPVSFYFGDTVNYAMVYRAIVPGDIHSFTISAEWLWDIFTYLCRTAGLSVNAYFLLIELGYILVSFAAVKKFVPTSPWLGTLFLTGALFFFSFGTNGLRNGLACSFVLLVIAYMLEERYIKAVIFALIALSIHRSAALPLGGTVMALTFLKNPRYALYGWIFCILLSLIAGNYWTALIADIGFDDRLAQYANTSDENLSDWGSTSSFRWDFLIYSAVPVVYSFYVMGKGLRDGWFNTLVTTYLVANTFWVLMIRAAFSNRFAYLSWFLIPVIFVYPLCNMRVWKDQNFVAGLLLISYVSITVIFLSLIW